MSWRIGPQAAKSLPHRPLSQPRAQLPEAPRHKSPTEHLTCLHTGGRSAADIDAGGVLSGYTGAIVRDGYAGYDHLADALHAWCGAHNLRDLRDLYTFDPEGQVWARSMADLLIHANAAATAARAASQARLSDDQLAEITAWYPGAVAKGITDNQGNAARSPGMGCGWPAASATTRT